MTSKMKRAQLELSKLDLKFRSKPASVTCPLKDRGFDVEEVLGSGSVACVKRVRRKSDGAVYAAKCVDSSDPEVIALTKAEFQLLSSLSSSLVIKAMSFIEGQLESYVLMEYCEGGDLENLVQQRKGLSSSQARHVCVQLLQGIDCLHCKRIVHRDLKPSNILFADSRQEQVKIADLNSATQLAAKGHAMLSHRCTTDYAAPELLLGWIWNERVDIWSLGLCIFFATRQNLPFTSGSARTQSYFMDLTLPEIEWGDLPDNFRHLVLECLVVDMRGRAPAMELLQHPAIKWCGSREDGDQSRQHPDECKLRCWSHASDHSMNSDDSGDEVVVHSKSDGYSTQKTCPGASTSECILHELAVRKMMRGIKTEMQHPDATPCSPRQTLRL